MFLFCVSNWPISFYPKIICQGVLQIARLVEGMMENFPRRVGSCRDIGGHYDVLEACDVLRRIESLPAHYEFSNKLPFSLGVFTERGKCSLQKAVLKTPAAS